MRPAFTLIEAIVVIGLMAVISVSAVTVSLRSVRSQDLSAATARLQSALKLAQTNALAGRTNCVTGSLLGWQITLGVSSYTLSGICTDNSVFDTKTENYSPSGSVKITAFPSPNPILFKALGHGTTILDTTTITLGLSGLTRNIICTRDRC